MNLHGRIKQLRVEKGLTQDDIANILGVPRPTYTKWEKNIDPDYDTLVKIARYYGVSCDFLLYGADPNKEMIPGAEVLVLADDGSGGHQLVDISTLPENEQKTILNIIETYKKTHQK